MDQFDINVENQSDYSDFQSEPNSEKYNLKDQ